MISRHAGFTIIELMIVVAMIAVLAAVAAPSLRDLVKNTSMTSQTNDFMTDLSIARAEAVKRGVRTAVCARPAAPPPPVAQAQTCTGGSWRDGWIIFVDTAGTGVLVAATDIIKVVPALTTDTTITSVGNNDSVNANGGRYVGFRPSGVVKAGGGGADIVFDICDSRTTASVGAASATNKGRRLTISGTGRAFIVRQTCL